MTGKLNVKKKKHGKLSQLNIKIDPYILRN